MLSTIIIDINLIETDRRKKRRKVSENTRFNMEQKIRINAKVIPKMSTFSSSIVCHIQTL